jgi:hypothetical protein
MQKTLYTETIETATISLIDATTDYIVTLQDKEINKRVFCLTYEEAINLYDNTVMQSARIYNANPKGMEQPNFILAIRTR